MNVPTSRMRLFATRPSAPVPPATPAADQYRENAAAIERLTTELGRTSERLATATHALTDAETAVARPSALREQLATAEAAITAEVELTGKPVDASALAPIERALADAEVAASTAAPRVRVESAKRDKLTTETTAMRVTLQQLHRAHGELAEAALWERLQRDVGDYTAARAAFLEVFNRVFATAMACDRLAQSAGTGRYAGGGVFAELVLPCPSGCDPLPITLREHWDATQARATELLKQLGLSG
jgi:hypothetical protein